MLPKQAASTSLMIDLFGEPLSSGSEGSGRERATNSENIAQAAETQATCLTLAHVIYGHVAWMRAAYRAQVQKAFPAEIWAPAGAGASSDNSAAAPRTGRADLCAGTACLDRIANGLPANRGRPGPTGNRCHRCREDDATKQAIDILQNILDNPGERKLLAPNFSAGIHLSSK